MRLDEYGILLRPLLDETWRLDALCFGTDTTVFFSDDPLDIAVAKATCDKCPVRIECRDSRKRGDEGVWGGETEEEQRRRKRQTSNNQEGAGCEGGSEEPGDSCTED